MNLLAYKTTIFSWKTLKKLVSSFLQAVGTLAILLGILDIFFPTDFALGFQGLFSIGILSLIWGIVKIFPRFKISRYLPEPDTTVIIKVGDLFEENANLVIGMNDVFDTEKGDIIKQNSVQGQFLEKVYGSNRSRLDTDLSNALASSTSVRDSQKTQGKNMRYPIGTVATLSIGTKKYFCSAYSFMANDLKAQSDIPTLTTSLEALWEQIRIKGQRERVSMAVLGSDLARIGEATHSNLIKLIVSSFILASRKKKITQELTIIIYPKNLEKVNMVDLDDFLKNF